MCFSIHCSQITKFMDNVGKNLLNEFENFIKIHATVSEISQFL